MREIGSQCQEIRQSQIRESRATDVMFGGGVGRRMRHCHVTACNTASWSFAERPVLELTHKTQSRRMKHGSSSGAVGRGGQSNMERWSLLFSSQARSKKKACTGLRGVRAGNWLLETCVGAMLTERGASLMKPCALFAPVKHPAWCLCTQVRLLVCRFQGMVAREWEKYMYKDHGQIGRISVFPSLHAADASMMLGSTAIG